MPKAMNLKYLRLDKNLSQKRLADELGVTRSTIIAWEKQNHSIPKGASERIASYFGISYHDFCNVDFEKKDKETISGRVERLTYEEAELLSRVRSLNDKTRSIVIAALDAAYKAENEQ